MFRAIFASVLLTFNCAQQSRLTEAVSEVVSFDSNGVLLEGILEIPAVSEKAPVAVFLHGSGQVTRRDYQEFTAPLHAKGWATFRYDKRGVGGSAGTYINVGTANSIKAFDVLAGDGAAAVKMLRADRRIDPDRVVFIGGSQAGWLIPLAATKVKIRAVICISGPAVSVGEEIFYSDMAEHGTQSQEDADRALTEFNGLKGFDPVPYLSQLKIPSLWLLGGKDVSIPLKRTIVVLDSIKSIRKLPMDIKLYPDADHGLFNSTTRTREKSVEYAIEWLVRH